MQDCYDCGKEFELKGNWNQNNVTFKDSLEVFLCDSCMKKQREKTKKRYEEQKYQEELQIQKDNILKIKI